MYSFSEFQICNTVLLRQCCFWRMLILYLFESSTSQEITGQEVCIYGEGWEEGEPAILYYTLGGAIFTCETLQAGWGQEDL